MTRPKRFVNLAEAESIHVDPVIASAAGPAAGDDDRGRTDAPGRAP